MTGVLSGFGLIAAIVAVGYALGRWRVLGEGAGTVLSRMAFFVGVPALLFTTLLTTETAELVSPRTLVGWGSVLIMVALYVGVARFLLHRPAGETVVGALCASYVNAGNLGIPIAVYALGGAAAVAPAMIFQLVVLAPTAFVALDSFSRRGTRSRLQSFVLPLVNPILLGVFAGLICALLGWQPPQVVMAPIGVLAGLAVPTMLLAFGISLRGAPLPGRSVAIREPLILASGLKSLAHPLVAWLLGVAVGLSAEDLFIVVVVAALPTAQNVFTYAMRYGQGVALSRESVLTTTIVAVPVILLATALLH